MASPNYTLKTRAVARTFCHRQASCLGIKIEERFDGSWFELLAEAPADHMITGTGVHEVVIANAGPQVDGLWERLADELKPGIEPCTNGAECEWCHES